MNGRVVLRLTLFSALFSLFLGVLFFAVINAGDEDLSPQARSWLETRVTETASTHKGAIVAASLAWRTKDDKGAGNQVVNEIKELQKLEAPARWDAINNLSHRYVKSVAQAPAPCQKSQVFCEPDERDRMTKEIERVREGLTLFRELFKEEGLALDTNASVLSPELSAQQLLLYMQYDLRDLGFNVDREPVRTIEALESRARFWRGVMHENVSLPVKMVAIANFQAVSIFTRDWVLNGFQQLNGFKAKDQLLDALDGLRANPSAEDFRAIMESSLIRETQSVADGCAMMKARPMEAAVIPGAKLSANTWFARAALAGFQVNRTVNLVQRLFEESLAAACLDDPESAGCTEPFRQSLQMSWYGRFKNPVGRRVLEEVAAEAAGFVHKAHTTLKAHNEVLDLVAEALKNPGPESLNKLKGVNTQKTALAN